MSQTNKFFVQIQCKPYVCQFLTENYGYPINLSKNPEAHKFFTKLLHVPSYRREHSYPPQICTYTELIEVVISEHDFYHYGFELTRTDTVAFGKFFENKAKLYMRSMVGVYHAVGLPIHNSIRKFQERFNYDEETWSYQTIKKDFYRNGSKHVINFDDEIYYKLEKIILRNLYKLGTVCQPLITAHENNKQTD